MRIRKVFPSALKDELEELVPATLKQVVRGQSRIDLDGEFPACSIEQGLGQLFLAGVPNQDETQEAQCLVTIWEKVTSDLTPEKAEDVLEDLSEAVIAKILEPDSITTFYTLSPPVYLHEEERGPAIEWLGFVNDDERQFVGLVLGVNYNGDN